MTQLRVLPYTAGLYHPVTIGEETKIGYSGQQSPCGWIMDPSRPRAVWVESLVSGPPDPIFGERESSRRLHDFTSAMLAPWPRARHSEYGRSHLGVAFVDYESVRSFMERYRHCGLWYNSGALSNRTVEPDRLASWSRVVDLPSDLALAVQLAGIDALMFRPVPRPLPRLPRRPPSA